MGQVGSQVRILELHLLDIRKELANVTWLERHILIIAKNILLRQHLTLLWLIRLLSLVLIFCCHLVLGLFVKVGDDRFDLVAEQVFFALVDRKLDAKGLTQIAHQRGFIMYSLEAGKFLLFAGELMTEPQLSNLFDFIVDLSRCNANKTRRNQPVQTTRKNWL